MHTYDVIIIGGGPAGAATAISLRAHDPLLSVLLVDSSDYNKPRIGEFLPSIARDILKHLGLHDTFQDQGFRAAHSTSAAWEDSQPVENNFIYSYHGHGWHLDRARFDNFLARQASARGTEIMMSTRVTAIDRSKGTWRLSLGGGSEVRARFVVDATGRRAVFARKMGANPVSFDRLIAVAGFFPLEENPEPGTLIEAFSEGWWYTTPAGNYRVVACMTDHDIAKKLLLRNSDRWLDFLFNTSSIGQIIDNGKPLDHLITGAANSVHLDRVCADHWLAVGDAASAFDPLSGQGIVKSLRSGIFASYAIADKLSKSDSAGLARYEKFIQKEFASYKLRHTEYYGEQRRWPKSSFWHRRNQN